MKSRSLLQEPEEICELTVLPAVSSDHDFPAPNQGLQFHGRKLPGTTSSLRWAMAGVATILFVQALLSLRFTNSAFTDEALYLWAGHVELLQWVHGIHQSGAPIGSFATYFSGDPYFYPPIAAALASFGGLVAVRNLSLCLMMLATAGVYGTGRRLFGVPAGLMAAGLFGLSPSVLFLGHFATFDPLAAALVISGAWLALRARDAGSHAGMVLVGVAGMVTALGGVAKYTGLLFIPVVAGVALLVFADRMGWKAGFARGGLFLLGAFTVLIAAWLPDPQVVKGIYSTSVTRDAFHGVSMGAIVPMATVLGRSLSYIGAIVAIGVLGAVIVFRRERDSLPKRLLAIVLLGAGLVVTAVQMHLHTANSLYKHDAYGLGLAAVVASQGLMKVVRAFRGRGVVLLSLVMVALLLYSGATYQHNFSWPNETRVVRYLDARVQPGNGVYLADEGQTFEYYTEDLTNPRQWVSPNYFSYWDAATGQQLSGRAAFAAAIRQGYFNLILLSSRGPNPRLDMILRRDISRSLRYDEVRTMRNSRHGSELWTIFVRVPQRRHGYT